MKRHFGFRRLLATLAMTSVLVTAPALAQDYNDGFIAAAAGDYETAVAKWQPLAENGDANAQFNLALIYHKGLGVPADEALAVGWYHRAASNGNLQAQEFLTAAYSEGWFGLPRNPELAQYWQERMSH